MTAEKQPTADSTTSPEDATDPAEPKRKSGAHVKTFRQGAIAANVFRRTAQGGFEYLDFSLSRAWKVPSGKDGYSQNFFEVNEEALFDVIQQACRFIRENQVARRVTVSDQRPVAKAA